MPTDKGTDDATDPVLAAWALTALAGCVDALVIAGGVRLLPVYVTGDTTRTGAALADFRPGEALPLLLVVLTFLAGSTLAAWLAGRARRHALAPLLLTGLFLLVGLLAVLLLADGESWPLPAILAAAAAMGAVNQVLMKDPGVTFVTGATVRLARDLAAGKAWEAGKNFLRWFSLLLGAVAGTALHRVLGPASLAVPAAAALLAALAVALLPPSPRKDPA